MAVPTRAQMKAVHNVLYSPARTKRLSQLAIEIANRMNFDPEAELQERDIRNPPGSGPNWFIAATGAVDPLVIEAAGLCDQLAKTLLEMRSELAKVSIPAADKQSLLTLLDASAASWSARGRIWRAPNASDAKKAAAEISNHFVASMEASRKARLYLKKKGELPIR